MQPNAGGIAEKYQEEYMQQSEKVLGSHPGPRKPKKAQVSNLVELDQFRHHVQASVVMNDPGSDPLGEAVQVSGDLGEPVVDHDDGTPVPSVADATAEGLWRKGQEIEIAQEPHKVRSYQRMRLV